jgi:hypothetical protein
LAAFVMSDGGDFAWVPIPAARQIANGGDFAFAVRPQRWQR